jgi:hypothetical protein
MLRLFLAWRLLRMPFPLLLFAFAALTLTTAFRSGPRTFGRGPLSSSLAHVEHGVERVVTPVVSDARKAVTHALTGATR